MKKSLVAAICAVITVAAQADPPKRKPGLWEVQYTMAMAGMPGGGRSPAMSMRYCLSPEDAADLEGYAKRLQKSTNVKQSCERDKPVSTASEVRFHSVCREADGSVTRNDSRVYDITPVSYAAEWTGKSSAGMEVQMQQTARWVGSDCGSVQ
jgi:hypothetical protein